MAKTIQELREERSVLAQQVHDLVNNVPEGQEWTAANDEDYNQKIQAIDKLDKAIERQQKVLDLHAENYQNVVNLADHQHISTDEATHQKQQQSEALCAFLRGGISALSDEQYKALRERNTYPQNALSTGTGSEGGYTVQDEFSASLIEAMKAFGGMRQVSTVIRTASGSQMDFPTADATSEEGEIVGENVEVTDEDPTFGIASLNTFKYSSKGVAVPFELLQDSEIDIESYIRRLLAMRLGRITERHFTVGTASGQPGGVIPLATVGRVGLSATSITYDDLIDLEHSVDPAYRNGASVGFMFHDSTLRELRKLKDDDGRPLWMPSLLVGEPNTINGRRYTINQNMAPMGSSARSVAFGDFSKYIIRDVMQIALFRMTDSAYTRLGQVGFLAFMRSGGNLIDVGGAVKVFQNAA